jgi:hypothetical protein
MFKFLLSLAVQHGRQTAQEVGPVLGRDSPQDSGQTVNVRNGSLLTIPGRIG